MKFNHDGLTLWYGTKDAPAPEGMVECQPEILIKVGVKPLNPSNVVIIRYRINGAETRIIRAIRLSTDDLKKLEYFQAKFPPFSAGDVVEFVVICQCAGRQVPDPATAKNFISSFQIVETKVQGREARKSAAQPSQLARPTDLDIPILHKIGTEPIVKPRGPSFGAAKGDSGDVKPERMSREWAETALDESLQSKRKLEQEIRKLRAKIRALEQRLKRLQRTSRLNGDIEELINLLDTLRVTLQKKIKELSNLEQTIERLRRRLEEIEPSVNDPLPGVSDRYPILLFPVRLETRFMPKVGAPEELWVRIYPDQVSIDTHEPELTAQEVNAGKLYNERILAANALEQEPDENDEEKKKQAWRALAGQVGPGRAAWIIKKWSEYDGVSQLSPESSPETPKVHVMPDYFVVRVYQRDLNQEDKCVAEKRGARIPDPLPVLWNFSEEREDGELFDDASNWIINFDAAKKAGMAVVIPLDHLTEEEVKKGFSRVVAVGVKRSVSEKDTATLIEDLINDHHYTDGISFLPHGTPTNNTEKTSSGHSRSERDLEHSYEIECKEQNNDETEERGETNAERIAKYLGIDKGENSDIEESSQRESIFTYIENAGNEDLFFGKAMRYTLWHATWGIYFKLLNIKSSSDIAQVRKHYVDFVNARGPLPSLRIGNLPYGILPVAKIRGWIPTKKDWIPEGYMYFVLRRLFDLFFKEMSTDPETIPRVGATDDPDQELLRILAMEPNAISHSRRTVVPNNLVEQMLSFMAPYFFGSESIYAAVGGSAYEWTNEWISTWQEQLEANANLLNEITGLETNADISAASPYLLNLIHWGRAVKLPGQLVWPNEAHPLELSLPNGDSLTWNVGGHLRLFIDSTLEQIKMLSSQERDNEMLLLLSLLDTLSRISFEENEKHFRDCLDLSTHRLDAWITSLATKRLYKMREEDETGIYIGAYGWVEDLRPRRFASLDLSKLREETTAVPLSTSAFPTRATSPEAITASVLSRERLTEVSESPPASQVQGGYIHAPSIPQATASAVLRSAYLTRVEDGIPEAAKINLTSERVRLALRLINGVQEGQQLGALLGYQFERGLHERSQDQFIDVFRNIFPLQAGKETELQEDEAVEAVAARNVVDGLALATGWRNTEDRSLSTLSSELQEADEELIEELDRLVESLDAVSDLWFAEAIYQGTQGRYERMGAALDAAAGVGPVPEVECVKTPRSGLSHNHRVCVLFSNERTDPDAELNIDSRASAEPLLNRWAHKVLGSLENILCRVRIPSEGDLTINISIATLGISYIDFVYLSSTPPSGEESELEQLIRYKVRTQYFTPHLSADTEVLIDLDPTNTGTLNTETKSFAEAVDVARNLLDVIGNSTPLRPSMICLPEEEGVEEENGEASEEEETETIGVYTKEDYDDLFRRVESAMNSLVNDVESAFYEEMSDEEICTALDKARTFGIPSATPASTIGDDLLASRKNSVLEDIKNRKKKALTFIAAAEDHANSGPYDNAIKNLISAMKALFGESFTVLPTFPAPRHEELQQALGADILDGNTTDRIWLWLQQAAQTHPSLRRFETALMMAEAWCSEFVTEETSCDSTESITVPAQQTFNLLVAQLPYRPDDRWIALVLSEEDQTILEERRQGCLSLAIHAPFPLDIASARRVVSGILIDQWEEPIPSKEEVTGLSFNYDQPSAQAPQALLLAVPGEWNEGHSGLWRLVEVFETVCDTMDLMKVRAVDLDALRRVGQFLPALYLNLMQEKPMGQLRKVLLRVED